MRLLSLVLVPTLSLFAAVTAAPEEDRIVELPLFGTPPTPQYSGYLDGTDGCDTTVNGAFCKIHYWYAASELDDAPVVLWLNGGPGSSSILGLLQENGPLLMNSSGGLMENPWSWTKVAHLLVIESPIGVGYSYCQAQAEGKVCQNTDKFTASTARAALVDFFTNKFPELANRDFFVTGESYAGVYVPTLAKELLDHSSVNLVGLAVGDPCTDNDSQAHSMDALWYGHKYGLVDDATFDTLWTKCGARISSNVMKSATTTSAKRLAAGPMFQETPECTLAFRKFLLSTSGGLSQSWKDLFIDDYSLFAPVSNAEDSDMQIYMNRDDVKAALHVEETPIDTWPYPTQGFDYTKEYNACNEAPSDSRSMIDFYRELAPQLKLIWVYNGDTDPCVSYEGTRKAISRVGFPEVDGGSYRPWFYNQSAAPLDVLMEKAILFGPNLVLQNVGAQFGGEVVDYANRLSFVTFHGSGHMVPQFRPQAALHFLYKFVNYEELSPLLPFNKTLLDADDDTFEGLMEQWTEDAKSAPYVDDWTWMERSKAMVKSGEVELVQE